MARLGRLEALLGAALADVNEAALERLITEKIREYQDLDFKRVATTTTARKS
ncbi:hypothetical protein [Phytoactinopolyspora endophytica]|uniref:hypothetical protein n=1 Tax=Phytoactinopolyspora endophytica TaxID=1642495 RepID=UPI0013EC3895|nr:hypothetical protein [Phytoactinopolyspora endophytica]